MADTVPTTADVEEALISVLEIFEPKTYRQARMSVNWDDWKKATEKELASLMENDVSQVVPKPPHRKIVDCKWVFKVKADKNGKLERLKARLVARGFPETQGHDLDETFSPVVRYDSLRFFLAIAAHSKWTPRQLDLTTAFLCGLLREEVYMQLPEGSRLYGYVARLKRCNYGHKQSPQEWYFRLDEFLIPFGFTISAFDPSVLFHKFDGFFITVYVDDITLFQPKGKHMESNVDLLKTEVKINDMGTLPWLLGIQFDFTPPDIFLSQT